MTTLVPLLLLGWIALAIVLFARLSRRQALLAVFVLGMLFLPEVRLTSRVAGMPEPLSLPGLKLTKLNAICYAALLASLLFDLPMWKAFHPRWFDLPMAVWCVCPLFSSLSNDLGFYDGVSQVLDQTVRWGVPYLLGRIYLGSPDGFRELAVGIVLAALVYVPFCAFEVRMSPQLHQLVYGYHQHQFVQTLRLGGYRPMVFMEHGLAVSLWMVGATLLAFWLCCTWAVPRLGWLPGERPLPTSWAAGVLLVVSVLCKSTAALALGMVGAALLLLIHRTRRPVVVTVLLAIVPLYIGLRVSGAWTGQDAVAWVRAHLSAERAQSLEFRLANEDLLVEKSLERPLFGWGGWGRARICDDEGKDNTVTDSLWIIALSDRGFFGLAALYLALLLPPARFLWGLGSESALQAATGGAVLLTLAALDSLLNAQLNPVLLLTAGSLAGLAVARAPRRSVSLEPAPPRWRRSARPLVRSSGVVPLSP